MTFDNAIFLRLCAVILFFFCQNTDGSVGSDWLAEQAQNNGVIQSSAPLSYPYASTAESLKTFVLLGESDRPLVINGRNYLSAANNSEYANKAQLLSAQAITGLYQVTLLEEVQAIANDDGGFGALKNHKSNVFNTALALDALYYSGSTDEVTIGGAIVYLTSQQNPDGGFAFEGDNSSDVALTALTSTVLQLYRANYSLSTVINTARDYLLDQRINNIGWQTQWKTALALIALSGSEPNRTIYQAAITELQSQQLANGSWDNDSYTTALALRALAMLDGSIVGPPTGDSSVFGQVVDSVSNLPIKNARITLSGDNPRSVLSNGQGLFNMGNIELGNYAVSIQKSGYQARLYDISLQSAQALDMGALPLLRQPDQGILAGVATDANTGALLSNVEITVNTVPPMSVFTTIDGDFEVALPPQELNITASKSGYVDSVATGTIIAGQTLQFSPALIPEGQTVDPLAEVKGLVVDAASNNPLVGVTVQVANGPLTVTDGSGLFSFAGLSSGRYDLNLSKTDYQGINIGLIAQAGINDLGTIALPLFQPPTSTIISGTVVDEESLIPIANANVTIPALGLSTLTDTQGFYQIAGVDQLDVSLSFVANGYQTTIRSIQIQNHGALTFDVQMQTVNGGSVSLTDIRTPETSYEPFKDVPVLFTLNNDSETDASVRLFIKILNDQGQIVEEYPKVLLGLGSTIADALETIPVNGTLDTQVKWSTRQSAPGWYDIVVEVFDQTGTTLLTQGTTPVEILATRKIGGFASFDPPITTFNAREPVKIQAELANRGNLPIDAGNVTAKVRLLNQGFQRMEPEVIWQDFHDGNDYTNNTKLDFDDQNNAYIISRDKILKRSIDSGLATVFYQLPTAGLTITDIDIAADGTIWLINGSLRQLIHLAADGTLIEEIATSASSMTSIEALSDRVLFSNNVSVFEYLFDGTINEINNITINGIGGSVITDQGVMYVCAYDDDAIYRFKNNKLSLWKDGINGPSDIVIDNNGDLLVSQFFENNVLKIDEQGNQSIYIDQVSTPETMSWDAASATLLVHSKNDQSTYRFDALGNQTTVIPRSFVSATAITVDSTGRKIISDSSGNLLSYSADNLERSYYSGAISASDLLIDGNDLIAAERLGIRKVNADLSGTAETLSDIRNVSSIDFAADGDGYLLAQGGSGGISQLHADGQLSEKLPLHLGRIKQGVVDSQGNQIIIDNQGSTKVIKIFPNGQFEVLYSSATNLESIAINAQDEIFLSIRSTRTIIKIDNNGVQSDFATLNIVPGHLVIDGQDRLLFSEYFTSKIYQLDTQGNPVELYDMGVIIRAMSLDALGTIWVRTSSRKVVKRDVFGTLTDINFSQNVFSIHPDDSGGMYFGSSSSVGYVDVNNNISTFFNDDAILPSESIYGVHFEADDSLWLFSNSGKIYKYDAQQNLVIESAGLERANDIAVDAAGAIYVVDSRRILKYNSFNQLPEIAVTGVFLKVFTAHSGDIYYSSRNTVYLLDPISGTSTTVASGYRTLGNLFVDSSQNVLHVVDTGTLSYHLTDIQTGDELDRFFGHDASIRSLLTLPNGEVIASSWRPNQVMKVRNDGMLTAFLPGATIRDMTIANDELVLSSGSQVSYYSLIDNSRRTTVVLNPEFIESISTYNGEVYAFTRTGITRIDGQEQLDKLASFDRSISDIERHPDGRILLSSRVAGTISRLNDDYSTTLEYSNIPAITGLSINQTGQIAAVFANKSIKILNDNEELLISAAPNIFNTLHVGFANNQLIAVVTNGATGLRELRKITIENPNSDINIGDVIYTFETQFPVLPTLTSTVAIDFGEFLPPISGDYQVTFDMDGVDNSVVNSIHVGDASFATLSLDRIEVLPGQRSAVLNVNIVGADNTSISQIEASSTSLAVESGTTGRAIASDGRGNIYSANRSAIIKIDSEGNTTEFVSGVTTGNGMAVDSHENIYFGSGRNLLRADQDGNLTEVTTSIVGITAVAIDENDTVFFGSTRGLFKVNQDGSNELYSSLATMNVQAISIDVIGQFHILDGSNNIFRLSADGETLVKELDGPAEGIRFEYEGVNLITDCSDNIIFAPFAFEEFDFNSEESIIVQRTAATGVYSQVLYGPNLDAALNDMDVLYYDKINSQILIWTDRNNGKIFSFPIVCGGIDVEFHLTPSDDVELTGFGLSADRIETKVDGTLDYIWALEDVGVDGVDFSINLDFLGLQEGEVRQSLVSAHLEFSNTFKPGENIIVPVDIPSISAKSQKTLDLSLDQTEYAANSNVEMTFDVFNGLDEAFDGYISISIEDAQGYLVDRLPNLPVIAAEGLSITNLIQLWDTALNLGGAYQVKAQLFDDQDTYLDEATAAFSVINDQGTLSVETRIFADQATYLTNDTVDLVGMVKNLSVNAVHPNSTGQIIVNDANGVEILNASMSIGEIISGANRQLSETLTLTAAIAGTYNVSFNNTDGNGNIYHNSTTTFEVIEVLADDLSGSVQVSLNPLYIDENTVCTDTIENISGEVLTDLTVRQILINLPDATIINQSSQVIDLAVGESLSLNRDVDASVLPAGNYACVLEAEKDGNSIVLGLQQFQVLAFNSINGVVWHDGNANQNIEVNEDYLSLSVNLKDEQGNIIETVTSNSDGTYQFSGLRDATYEVEADTNGAALTTVSPVVVALAQNNAVVDFGLLWNQGRISGVIWSDDNANGIFDSNELPVANVSVELLNTNDNSVMTIVSGAAGEFSFNDLLIGDYQLQVTDTNNVLASSILTTANLPLDVNIGIFESFNDANFGYQYQTAQIQTLIYNDANGNAIFDNGESTLSGVSIDLLSSGQLIASQQSDAFGVAIFNGLPAGSYQVIVTDNSGILNDALITTSNQPFDVVLNNGEINNTGVFGYQFANASISNIIFDDENGNGLQDATETGLPNVTVTLSKAGVLESTQTSDASGAVLFDNLVAGDYQVVVTDTNMVLTDATLTTVNLPYEVSLNSGDNDVAGNFGYQFANAFISNIIFDDENGNGLQDATETGISNVTVTLSKAGVLESTQTSDASGAVRFDNLVSGDYQVVVTDTNMVLTDATLTTANLPYDVLLNSGDNDVAVNFGYQFANASIANIVFDDANGNGIQDATETGLSNVTVTLSKAGVVESTQTSDASGAVRFDNLVSGDYQVVVTDTNMVLTDATLTTANLPYDVLLNSGDNDVAGNFGYQFANASISGVIFNDINNNGIQDIDESGIAGIGLDLANEDNDVTAQFTDEDGFYSFINLTAGQYTITVTDNAGILINAELTTDNQPLVVDVTASQNYVDGFIGYHFDEHNCVYDLGTAGPFNAVVFTDYMAQSSDVEGRLLAGGNISLNHYSVGDKLDTQNNGDVLIAGGDINFPSGRVYYGNIVAGGSTAGIGAPVINGMEPGATITEFASLPIDLSALETEMINLSQTLSGLASNTTNESQYGGLYLHGDCSSQLQVFNLDGQEVLNAHTFAVDCIPANATVIFNISGNQAGLTNMSMDTLASHRQRVLYNFFEAQQLTLAGISVEGTVLAPFAEINNPQGVIKGQMIAHSWNGMMQINHEPFVGSVNIGTCPADLPAVIWADSGSDSDALDWSGSENTVTGGVHSNSGIKIGGSDNSVNGGTTWVTDFENGGGNNQFVPVPQQIEVAPWPYPINLADYQPGGVMAITAGANYYDESNTCSNDGKWERDVQGTQLAAGLYWVPCDVVFNASNLDGNITIISTGKIEVSGSDQSSLNAYMSNILFWTNSSDSDAIKLSGSNSSLTGAILAPNGLVEVSGSDLNLSCGLAGKRLKLNGSNLKINQQSCELSNIAPTADDQTFTLLKNQRIDFTLTGGDINADALSFSVITAPQSGSLLGTVPYLRYEPLFDFTGTDFMTFVANDGEFESAPATITFQVNDAQSSCQLYPYIIAASYVDGLQVGDDVSHYATDVGQGNYSLLTWTGANDTNTLASSFIAPGDSETYQNPDDSQDSIINIGDWVQGVPGKKNARKVRDALDDLIGETITVPIWVETRGNGSQFDYLVNGFIDIKLSDYKLNGQSYISFNYVGPSQCGQPAVSQVLSIPQELMSSSDVFDQTSKHTIKSDHEISYIPLTGQTLKHHWIFDMKYFNQLLVSEAQ